MIESKAQFARRLGIHKSNVTRAAQTGRIVLAADGRVKVEESLARWQATKGGRDDVAMRHQNARQAKNSGAVVSVAQPEAENGTATPKTATRGATGTQPEGAMLGGMADGPAVGAATGEGRARYKALALDFENRSIKLEMALRRGLRYPLPLVKREAHGLGATVRAAMERIIDQTAPRLAVMTSDIERRRLIDAELRRLRWIVKSELPRSLRRMRAAGQGARGGEA